MYTLSGNMTLRKKYKANQPEATISAGCAMEVLNLSRFTHLKINTVKMGMYKS
jgi:hypothetical protein